MPGYELKQRPGSPYWYIAWSEGRRSRRYSTGTTEREQAELTLAAFKIERASGGAAPEAPGVIAVLDQYVEGYGKRLASYKQARAASVHLKGYFGLLTADKIDDMVIDGYVAWRKGVTDSTIARELSVLRAALRRKMGTKAPGIQAPKANGTRDRWLTRQEAARLLWASRRFPWLPTYIRLALYTGARPSAILGLSWERVDLEDGLADFRLPSRLENNKRRAVVPIVGALKRHLEWLSRFRRDGRVVPMAKITLKREFRLARADAGLGVDVKPYTLRHTHGSWAGQADVAMVKIGGMLGHSKLSTTQRYVKLKADHLRGAAHTVMRGSAPVAHQKAPPARDASEGGSQVVDITARMVGATGIEPVTPTMSRNRRRRNLLKIQGVALHKRAETA